jgi:alanyl-tRNA synthetase
VLGDGRVAVVVDRTPFHPLDHGWPDQPGDVGMLAGRLVVDCLTGTVDDDGVLAIGAEVPVRRGDATRTWVVVHVLDEGAAAPEVGETVALEVDAATRLRLSRGHSACHLAALALNEATARFWSKEPPRRDSRGQPFLDQLAITESRVGPDGAYDAYRAGRSLRKAGFDAEGFLADRDAVADAAAALLDDWVGRGGPSRIDVAGDPTVVARRTWVSEVPGGPASIPCGGTHVADLAELGRVRVAYAPTEAGFEAITTVTPA